MKVRFEEFLQLVLAVWMLVIAFVIIFSPENILIELGPLKFVAEKIERFPPAWLSVMSIAFASLQPLWSKLIRLTFF